LAVKIISTNSFFLRFCQDLSSFCFQKTQTLKVEKGVCISLAFSGVIYLLEDNIDLDNENIDFYIIDWKNPWSWEWYEYEKINELKLEKNFLVAGWISEKNVWEIFEIFKNNPYFCGVDIASWVDNGENICLEKVGRIVNKIKKNV